MNLTGQTVLVTAGAGGAGLVIAREFRRAGANVAICDIDPSVIAKGEKEDLLGIEGNVAEEVDVETIFSATETRWGAIDVLVNNVGVSGPTKPVEAISTAEWNHTMASNLTSHFLCIRRAVPAMKARKTGAIINISSGSAKVGLPLRAPYVVSKGAVLSLTMTLARELGPDGIRVNAILPGAIRGERIERVIRDKSAALGVHPAEYQRSLLRYISLRTMVEPEDIAAMALFLASDAGRRISGQFIGVDGHIEWEE